MLPTTFFTLSLLAAVSSVLVPCDAKATGRARWYRLGSRDHATSQSAAQESLSLKEEKVAVVTVNSHQRREAQGLPIVSSPINVITSVVLETNIITVTSCPPGSLTCPSVRLTVTPSVTTLSCFDDFRQTSLTAYGTTATTLCSSVIAVPTNLAAVLPSEYRAIADVELLGQPIAGPGARSACSCYLDRAGATGTAAGATGTTCLADDPLKALQTNAEVAVPFCSSFLGPNPPTVLPPYVSAFASTSVSSACSCLQRTVAVPISVLPTTCFQDDVLRAVQTFSTDAVTFCPNLLASPGIPLPSYVVRYGALSASSACSCFVGGNGGIGPVVTPPLPTPPAPPSTQCFQDDVLKAIQRDALVNPGAAISYCSALSVGVAPTATPTYLTSFNAAQVRSGCSCFYQTVLNPVTVLPTQCNLDDVLLALQFNPTVATTFCPTFLATPTAGTIPDIVRPFGLPSIISACSCYQRNAGGGAATPTPTAPPAPPSTQCFQDDVLKAIQRDAFLNPQSAISYCSALSVGVAPTSTPTYLTTFNAAQVRSGCSCFYKTVLNPETVLPTQCNLDDVLLAFQFNPSVATTFCPTFLATPTAGAIPDIVRPFGIPSIISACSCYQKTAGGVATPTPTTPPAPPSTQCFQDDLLKAIQRDAFLNPQAAISYCSALSVGVAPTSTPAYLTTFNPAQVRSGCSCFYKTVLNPETVLPTQCNLDDVLLAFQFNPSVATTFCPTFLATPTAGAIPDIVRPFGIPSIISACSCYQKTAAGTGPTSTPGAPTITPAPSPLPTQCFQDDVLKAIQRDAFLNPQAAISYCSALSVGGAPTSTPTYLTTFNAAQVRSGCSCFYKTVLNPETVLPTQCNLDDVLLAFQFNPSVATTFCPTFLATPTAGAIPDIVRPFGIPSIISACSCYQKTAAGTGPTSTPGAPTTTPAPSPLPTQCFQDDVLKAIQQDAFVNPQVAISYCSALSVGPAPTSTPAYLSAFNAAQVRSGCSCFYKTVLNPVTVLPTQCNLDDVLLALQFNPSVATTFCPTFLATPTAGVIPSIVRPFGVPSIISACSCYQKTAAGTSSTATSSAPIAPTTPSNTPAITTPPTPLATVCNSDDALRALEFNAVAAIPFCAQYLLNLGAPILGVPLLVPNFLTTFAPNTISSACSCFRKTVVSPVTVLPTQCNLDDVLVALNFNGADASTFCPNYLATPTGPIPSYVTRFGTPSIRSACSCFQKTAAPSTPTSIGPLTSITPPTGLVTPPTPPTSLVTSPTPPTSLPATGTTSGAGPAISPAPPATTCLADDVLKALQTNAVAAIPFCLTFLVPLGPLALPLPLPTFVSQFASVSVSSACSCLQRTVVSPVTVLPTTCFEDDVLRAVQTFSADAITFCPNFLASPNLPLPTYVAPYGSLSASSACSCFARTAITSSPPPLIPTGLPPLPTSILPSLPTSILPSLPTSVLPSLPTDVVPSLPTSILPSLPTSIVPSLPTSILPSLPTDLGPSLPTSIIPSLPTSILPSLPTDVAPSLPTSILPSLPTSILPSLPSSILPSLPSSILPSLPTDVVPSLPTSILPSLPTSGLPSLPTSILPSLPTSILPSLPSSIVPSVPSSLLPSLPTSILPSLPTSILPSLPTDIAPSLPTSILPSLPTSILPSLPTSILPSLPTSILPSLPTSILPSLPTSILPSLPTSILPSLPTSILPSLPTSILPSLPTSILPSLPTSILPSLPTSILPSLPTSILPSLPTSILPSLPTSILPSLPTSILPSLPSLPTSILPSLPTSILPSLPTSILPSLPTSILPSLPTSILPSLPSLPTSILPSLPTSILPSLPSLPTSILPSLPTSILPSLPTSILPPLPSLPTSLLPSLPTSILPSLPSLPTSILPSLPTSILPPLPSLPTSILPSLPTSILPPLPSLPTSILPPLPSLPTSILPPLPSLPTSILPPLPSLPISILPSLPTSILPPLPSLPTSILPTLPTIELTSSTTTATTAATCLADDVLKAVEFNAANAIPFCQSYLVPTRTVSLAIPSYLTQFATPSISSACSCLQRTVVSPVTVLPTICFQDDVLRAVQTFSADAITFCPTFLASPRAVTSIPGYVSRFGRPSINSACSCFQAVLTSSISPITPVTPLPTACITDDALRALERSSTEAAPFCSSYLTAPTGAVPVPSFVSSFSPLSISSACSCFGQITTLSTTSTSTSTAASCVQDTVLQALETFSSQAADFCPSLLAAPLGATVTPPFYVTAFPSPSVRSACSCFVATTRSSSTVPTSSTSASSTASTPASSSISSSSIISTSSTSTSSSVTPTVSLICFEDGPLLALEASQAQAGPFCTSYLSAGGALPTFVAQFQPAEVSSACTCFGLRTGIQSTFTPVSTSSTLSSSVLSASTTSSSTTTLATGSPGFTSTSSSTTSTFSSSSSSSTSSSSATTSSTASGTVSSSTSTVSSSSVASSSASSSSSSFVSDTTSSTPGSVAATSSTISNSVVSSSASSTGSATASSSTATSSSSSGSSSAAATSTMTMSTAATSSSSTGGSSSSSSSSSSASSTIGSTSTSSSSTTSTSSTVSPTISLTCVEDAALQTLINDRAQADAFCPSYMMSGAVLAPFVAQFAPAQVSSACRCYDDRFGFQTSMSSTTTTLGTTSSSAVTTTSTTGSSSSIAAASTSTATASTSRPTSTAATSTGTGTGTASTSTPTSTAATSTCTTGGSSTRSSSISTRNTYSTSRTVTTVIGELTTVTVEPSVCIRRKRVRAVRKAKKA